MSAVKRSETHSRWSLTIHSSSIVHWSSASVVATRAATNGPKTTRADKQHLGLKETLKCTIPMQCMQKDNLVRNPFLVECSYLWESIYQFLWQRHQTMFNLDFKDFGHRSVWQGSPGGRELKKLTMQSRLFLIWSLCDQSDPSEEKVLAPWLFQHLYVSADSFPCQLEILTTAPKCILEDIRV